MYSSLQLASDGFLLRWSQQQYLCKKIPLTLQPSIKRAASVLRAQTDFVWKLSTYMQATQTALTAQDCILFVTVSSSRYARLIYSHGLSLLITSLFVSFA